MRLGFAGTGVAALLTAEAIVRHVRPCPEIVLVDRGFADEDDRTYAFWTRGDDALAPLLRQRFDRLAVVGEDGERVAVPLGAWRYGVLRGLDLRDQLLDRLLARPEVTRVEDEVVRVEERDDGVVLHGERGRHAVDWAFDSRWDLSDHVVRRPYIGLVQSFTGVRIATEHPRFDPGEVVLMDFRVPQQAGVHFVYVIPEDERHALIEGVHMAPELARTELEAYLRDALGLEAWTVEAREGGATPMTDQPFPLHLGARTARLGIAAGRLKPSTGYGLPRMLDDAEAIAGSLATHGHPHERPRPGWFASAMDAVFLRVVAEQPSVMPGAFLGLFERNPPDRVVRLLQDRATWRDLVVIPWTLPIRPFVRAAWRWWWAR